jgi:GWxTD domain-containing protein
MIGGTGPALAVLLLLSGLPGGQEGDRDLAVTARRFHRRDGRTAVEGVGRVSFNLIEPVRGGPDGFGAYRMGLVVRDSAGVVLTEQSWQQRVPAGMLDVPGASVVEQFRFGVPAGRYTVETSITDSASGRVVRSSFEVEAYREPPLASDLVVSAAIRPAADSGEPAAGEMRLGGFFVAAHPEPVLTPLQSQLFYYVELYPGRTADVAVQARVRTADGRPVIATQPETIRIDSAGVATSGVELAGLPPGAYRLELELALDGRTEIRSAAFRMAGLETQSKIAQALGTREADVFGRFTEEQLDSLYRPLLYLQERGERGVYEGLSIEGKRNYLRQFWARRDPTPGTPGNEVQDDFYRLIDRANDEFREGGAGDVPGWRTDRGRILIRYGAPDEVLRRPASGPTRPYEVWKYTHGRPRKFLFYDETGLGHYALIFTDERREPSRSDWEVLLGREAALDVQRF